MITVHEGNGRGIIRYPCAPRLDRAECVLPRNGGLAARGARIEWVATGKESAASLREGMQCRKSNQRRLPCLAIAHDYTPFEPMVWSRSGLCQYVGSLL